MKYDKYSMVRNVANVCLPSSFVRLSPLHVEIIWDDIILTMFNKLWCVLQRIIALNNSTCDSKNSPRFLSNTTVAMTNIRQHISLSQEAAITLIKHPTLRLSKVVHCYRRCWLYWPSSTFNFGGVLRLIRVITKTKPHTS